MGATEQLCTFFLDEALFGVEVRHVQEVVRAMPLTRVPLAPPALRGLLNLRGQIVPALDLRRRLGLAERPPLTPSPLPPGERGRGEGMNVVLRTDRGPVSLLVDRAGDVLEVAPVDFERPPETLRGPAAELVRGAYKLDGRLLLQLDVDKLIAVRPGG